MASYKGLEESVEKYEADERPRSGVEKWLEDIRDLNSLATNPNTFKNPDEFPSGDGIDKDDDEDSDWGHDQADGADHIAEESKGIFDILQKLWLSVFKGLDPSIVSDTRT